MYVWWGNLFGLSRRRLRPPDSRVENRVGRDYEIMIGR